MGACTTPAIGTRMLPTTGMNHTGLMCLISNFCCCTQMLSTVRVSTRWSTVPMIQKTSDVVSLSGQEGDAHQQQADGESREEAEPDRVVELMHTPRPVAHHFECVGRRRHQEHEER